MSEIYGLFTIEQRRRGIMVRLNTLRNLALVLVFIAVIFEIISLARYTGFVSFGNGLTYFDNIDRSFTENGTFEWNLTTTQFDSLNSIKLNGYVKGGGYARVYVEYDNQRYLIFDSDRLERPKSEITGLVVEENLIGHVNETSEEQTTNQTVLIENITAEINITNETYIQIINITNLPQDLILNETINITGNLTEYSNITSNLTIETINETTNLTTIKEEIVKEENPKTGFEAACIETCNINFFDESYNLIVDVENAELYIGYIDYLLSGKNLNVSNMTTGQINESSEDIQLAAEINKPVKWKKNINLENSSNISVNLRKDASNIKVKKKDTGIDISDKVIENKKSNETEIVIKEIVKDIEIEYETPPPQFIENNITEFKKLITISSDIPYKNVLSYINLQKETKKEGIKLYWIINGTKQIFENVTYKDLNNNDLVDRIEWVVPHLSNQTFELSLTILNPVTYLRDNETWTVKFETTGIADLIISSNNSYWEEIQTDDKNTTDEMRFINISCNGELLHSQLKIIDSSNNTLNYSEINQNDIIKPNKFLLQNYSCNGTGEFSNFMNIAGYAILNFTFGELTEYAYDPSSGPRDGSTFASDGTGSYAWVNPSNAQTSNNQRAAATSPNVAVDELSDYLQATGFGFSIPPDDTINGIVVEIERRVASGSISESSVLIIQGGVGQGTDHSGNTAFPSTEAYKTYGTSTDLWGLIWTAGDINSANFGVQINVMSASGVNVANIDHIRITVYYTTQPDTTQPGYVAASVKKNETNVYQNMFVNFTANWTDNVKLDSFIFSINTGSGFVNSRRYTFGSVGNSGNVSSNVTYITATVGTNVSWKFIVNDTSNNIKETGPDSFLVLSTIPNWTAGTMITNTTSFLATGYMVNFSSNWSDNSDLDSYIFELNQTGAYVNSTSISFGSGAILTGTSSNVTRIQAPYGFNLTWRFWANDSNSNWNFTPLQSFVVTCDYNGSNNWIINATCPLTSKAFFINGNITILDRGNLSLRNINLTFNISDYAKNITIYSGGILEVLDLDNNNNTIDDQSYLNRSINGGIFCGDACAKNYTFLTGLGGSHIILKNSYFDFIINITINGSSYITNNTFSHSDIALYNSNLTLSGNKIFNATDNLLWMRGIENVTLERNYLMFNGVSSAKGLVIYDSRNITIKDFTLHRSIVRTFGLLDLIGLNNVTFLNNVFNDSSTNTGGVEVIVSAYLNYTNFTGNNFYLGTAGTYLIGLGTATINTFMQYNNITGGGGTSFVQGALTLGGTPLNYTIRNMRINSTKGIGIREGEQIDIIDSEIYYNNTGIIFSGGTNYQIVNSRLIGITNSINGTNATVFSSAYTGSRATNIKFINSIIVNQAYDLAIYSNTTGAGNEFINVSFNRTNVFFDNTGRNNSYFIKWYLDVNVTYSNGTNATNSNVTFYMSNTSFEGSDLVGANGFTRRFNTTEFVFLQGNDSLVFKNYSTNYTITANTSVQSVSNYSSIFNITSNMQWNITLNIPDINPPNWTAGTMITNTTSFLATGYMVNFSSNWSDNSDLDSYIFELNQTGAYVNSTSISFGSGAILTGTSSNVTRIQAAYGYNLTWRFWANDSNSNWNFTPLQSFVVSCDYNGTGDWIINTTCSLSSKAFYIDGNITIRDRGNLSLRNVNLTMNNIDYRKNITIYTNGVLEILDLDNNNNTIDDRSIFNHSIRTAPSIGISNNNNTFLVALNASTLIFKNSLFDSFGNSSIAYDNGFNINGSAYIVNNSFENLAGFYFYNNNLTFLSNRFENITNSRRGLVLIGIDNITIENNHFIGYQQSVVTVHIQNTTNLTFNKNSFVSNDSAALVIEPLGKMISAFNSNNLTITNNVFNYTGTTGSLINPVSLTRVNYSNYSYNTLYSISGRVRLILTTSNRNLLSNNSFIGGKINPVLTFAGGNPSNNTIEKTFINSSHGITSGGSGNTFIDTIIYFNSTGVALTSAGNIFKNLKTISSAIGANSTSNTFDVANTSIIDSILNSTNGLDIQLPLGGSIYLFNVSWNQSNYNVSEFNVLATLIVYWYLDVNITYSNGTNATNANITAYDRYGFGNSVFSELVPSTSSFITRKNVTEWKAEVVAFLDDAKNYSTNYTITANTSVQNVNNYSSVFNITNNLQWNITLTISTNTAPNFTVTPNITSAIIPTPPFYANHSLNCTATPLDYEQGTLHVNFTWYKNTVLNNSFNSFVTVANGTATGSTNLVTGLKKYDNWTCSSIVYDNTTYSTWTNSSTIQISNNIPQVELLIPTSGNTTVTNRTPSFQWRLWDADPQDVNIYDLFIACQPGCSADNRSHINLTATTFNLTIDLAKLGDNNFFYNWTVRAYDNESYGSYAQNYQRNFSIQSVIIISIINASVNFSSLVPGSYDDTEDNIPNAVGISNDGNSLVNVNISLLDSGLWISKPSPTIYFSYKITNFTGPPDHSGAFRWATSNTSGYTPIPLSNITAIDLLKYVNLTNSRVVARVDINITVPSDEPGGRKNSTLLFSSMLGE